MQLYGKTLCLPKGSSPGSKKPKGEPGIGGDLKSWKSIWYGRSTSKAPPVWFERRCGGSGSGSSGDATGISGSGTKVSIGGKKAVAKALKSGMTCTIAYHGDKTTAASVACD